MGKQKVVVSERDNIATLFDDDRAVEFIINRGDTLLGDVYLGTVENILPSIDAAFINIGGDKMAFLHSSDVKGRGDLQKRLKPGQKMIVQVIKEPTGHKGPRVTTNISMPGRFLVFMPDSRGVSLSRKIESQAERSRLKAIVSMAKPHGVGVIIRTEANGQRDADITEDFEILLERWQQIVAAADATAKHALLYRDQDLLYRVIREVVSDEVDEIVVDTPFGQQRAQQLLQTWNLDGSIKVALHDGKQSIMVAQGVEREIKLALQTKVPLPSGGYLFIQNTEALTVVDVNSGKFTRLNDQAETIRLTNLEACKEIARQLRLRNIGGMIIVDFIDMESRAHQLSILEAFDKELAPDKAKPQMGQLTDLGLVEMTRHRQGQALSEMFSKECPMCHGKGHALEQFHWAAANAEAESKLFGRQQRNVPFKVQQRGRGYKSGSMKPLVTPFGKRDTALKHTDSPARVVKPVKPGDNDKQAALKDVLTAAKPAQPGPLYPAKPAPLDVKRLREYFNSEMTQTLGRPTAQVLQLGVTPDRYNRTLSRMNTKANDVLSLVNSIQAGGLDVGKLLDDPSPNGQTEGTGESGSDIPLPASGVAGKAPLIVDNRRPGNRTNTRGRTSERQQRGPLSAGVGQARSAGLPGLISSFLKKLPVNPDATQPGGSEHARPAEPVSPAGTAVAPQSETEPEVTTSVIANVTTALDAPASDASPTEDKPKAAARSGGARRRSAPRSAAPKEVTTETEEATVEGSADDKPKRAPSRRRSPSTRGGSRSTSSRSRSTSKNEPPADS